MIARIFTGLFLILFGLTHFVALPEAALVIAIVAIVAGIAVLLSR